MKAVKNIYKALFVLSFLCVNATHAMEEVSKEQQLLEGTISILEYLFYIEDNPDTWGDYSQYLIDLRTADYSNYPAGSLYDQLINQFGGTVTLNRTKLEGIRRGYLKGSLQSCIEHIRETIRALIYSQHALLNSARQDGTIGEALPEGI